ncbi:MAG: DUF1592 domain-containing protein [Planctomycetales bacterium]|nr:DUF1592 domain-containing protein [Planctomycetales bacterium]
MPKKPLCLNHSKWSLILQLMLIWFANTPASAEETSRRADELRHEVGPLLSENCLGCHSGDEPDGGLALDIFTEPLDFVKQQKVWRKAIQKIRIQAMPPPEGKALDANSRLRLVDWLSSVMDEFECGQEPTPGRVTMRRLNANEYKNTIYELLGIRFAAAANFPADDVGYGFDNIGDVLTLPPILMEKYVLAAEEISRLAIQTPSPGSRFEIGLSGSELRYDQENNRKGQRELIITSSEPPASLDLDIPRAGVYEITIQASGDQAGDEPPIMQLNLDSKPTLRWPVPNEPSTPMELSGKLRMRSGRHRIEIRFVNDFYQPREGQTALDRNLIIHHVLLAGEAEKPKPLRLDQTSASHRRIFFVQPTSKAELPTATRQIIQRLGSRVFRRPLLDEELDSLCELAETIQQDEGSFEESIQIVLQAMLISPKFLFRPEPLPSSGLGQNYRTLDNFELASRLSYFLWSSMPDEELFTLAWQKKLNDQAVLDQQIMRMLRDRRSNEFVKNFASQWLTLRRISGLNPDPTLFPAWDPQLAQLVQLETLNFFAGIMRRDLNILRLLDADFTYLNEPLSNFYGIGGVKGEGFREVSLAGTGRAGLLTQASILAVTSNPTRTSPVKRGKWILENLLATPPPPAPPGVPELRDRGPLLGTLKQQMEQHRSDPACANCHQLMDPLGFALENFDAIGRYRDSDRGQPIESQGVLPDGTVVESASELQAALVSMHSEEFVRCVTEKLLTYALGRGLEYYDRCAVETILSEARAQDFRFSSVIQAIVRSDPFCKTLAD